MNITYREWEQKDFEQVQYVLLQTWIATYSPFIPLTDIQWYFNNHNTEIHLERVFADSTMWNYVAAVDQKIVGYERMFHDLELNRFHIASLYVLPEFQGQGIGKRLLEMAEEKARSLFFDKAWLGVMTQNTASVEWYKKLGFIFETEEPFVMGRTTVQHLIGYKNISTNTQ